jgi:ribonuclease P protein component
MLSIQHRLTKREDFNLVYKQGHYVACDGIALKFLKTNHAVSRLGFPVGKNYSKKATARNRIRRLLREGARKHLPSLNPSYDLVILLNPKNSPTTFAEIASVLEKLFSKANLLTKSASQTKK